MKKFKRLTFIRKLENQFYTLWTKLDWDLNNLLVNEILNDLSMKVEVVNSWEIKFYLNKGLKLKP